MAKTLGKRFSTAVKRQLMERIARLREGGLSGDAACKKVGIGYSTYHSWKTKEGEAVLLPKKFIPRADTALPRMVTLNLQDNENLKKKLFVAVGEPQDVKDVLAMYHSITGSNG